MENFPEGTEVPNGNEMPCDFDRSNKKSPCHYEKCHDDDSDPGCVRYVLDYCLAFDDRGCVIQLPHLLNKLSNEEYNEIQNMKSDFKA